MTIPPPAGAPDATCTITVLGFPIDVWRQYREHNDELMREFTLIAASEQRGHSDSPTDAPHEVPRRLLDLVASIKSAFGDFSGAQTRAIEEAAARGDASIDLTYQVSPSIGGPARALKALLEEADDYCRAGRHLLTLASPPETFLLRRWYFEEFGRQAEGSSPVSWPDFLTSNPLPSQSNPAACHS